MKNFIRDFIKCGIAGWCMEICFTALDSLRRRDMKLMGHTSLWMFPIYASAAFLKPLFLLLKGKPVILRGLSYAVLILTGEYITGSLLCKFKNCPWDYTRSKWHIKKIVRLDYLLNWVLAGLFFEHLLIKNKL
ncbi:MAG: putative ABC transporter permease [Lachnospiraceae bacterium]|nr:putative ABC transporter permease [Lachnospiraceae bacterium]